MPGPADAIESAGGKAVDVILATGGLGGAVAILAVAVGLGVAGLFWWESKRTRTAAETRLDECAKQHAAIQDRRVDDLKALLVTVERNNLVLAANEESRRGIIENMGELLQGFAKVVQALERSREQNDRIERGQEAILTLLRSLESRAPRARQ